MGHGPVMVADEANLRRVQPEIGPLLADLEQRGLDRLRLGYGDLRERARSISVESCWSFEANGQRPPGYRLVLRPKGAFEGDSERIVREIDRFLPTVPDVAAKLRTSGLPETHAVVVVTPDRFDLFVTLDSEQMPVTAPLLPEGVDGLWLLAFKSAPMRAVYWLGDGWRRVTLTDDHLSVPLAHC